MIPVSKEDIKRRVERDNFWWQRRKPIPEDAHPRRTYFSSFKQRALNMSVKRATILLGPRRVGKTFMVKQLIAEAIDDGMDAESILFASVDTPVFFGMALEKFLDFIPHSGANKSQCLVVFDEIQYLRDWEIHLKDLVDSYPQIKFIATGSAAAALKLKSRESGAGRFSEFMLPPLTFHEFMMFSGKDDLMALPVSDDRKRGRAYCTTTDLKQLNKLFIDYLNFGGYPEAVLNKSIRDDPEQFIKNDIIERVLLRDLPSLYGIHEIRDLSKLFSFLAYNAGNEASLENICQGSGLTKPTIKKYIEYLESAFLIIKIATVDENCKSLERERNFKIYLNNPSMRAALFGPVDAADTRSIGHLTESAIFSQWQHAFSFGNLRYARWKKGEVDIVSIAPDSQKPIWIGEIKWSDRIKNNAHDELSAIRLLVERHPTIKNGVFTTKSIYGLEIIDGKPITVVPSAIYCYTVGRNVTSLMDTMLPEPDEQLDLVFDDPETAK